MKDKLCQQLAASPKEGADILCGEMPPHADPQQPSFEQRATRGNNADVAEILANVPDTPRGQ